MKFEQGMDARIVANMADALIATRADGVVVFWNDAARAMFGYAAEEALGQPLASLIEPPGAPDVSSSDQGHVMETVRRCKDGSLIYVHLSTRPLAPAPHASDAAEAPAAPVAPGSSAACVISCADITHLRVQRDARLIDNRYRELLESTPDAIVIVNDIGRIVYANGQAESLFHYRISELVGQPLELLMPARFRAGHGGHLAQYMARSRQRPMGLGLELQGLRKNGEEFPVEISLSPLDTGMGRMGMSAIRDMTYRREVEHALQEKNLELERANRAKDRFLATMSHELRTPLNAIIGFTSLMLMKLPGPLTPDQEKQLGMVHSSAKHLLSLINDLLDLAKVESGNVQIHLAEVACRPLVEEVVATLRPAAEAKGLALALQMPPGELVLQTDRRVLQQILLNLGSNAIKFTDQGQVKVVVTTTLRQGQERMAFAVEDTGGGIADEDQARLFQAFAQVGEDSRRPRVEGTGLGLYLCRKLSELIGGQMELQSEVGRGSRFALLLPCGPGE